MRCLIIGAGGFTGYYLSKEFAADGNEVIGTFHDRESSIAKVHLDISNENEVQSVFSTHKPNVVILSAYQSNVDGVEKDPLPARKTNVDGVKFVANACKQHNAKLVFLSSSYVFDGEKETPYSETDNICPVQEYGKMKVEGEQIVQSTLKDFIIARTVWVYGWDPRKANFVERMITNINAGQEFKVPVDQFGTPTLVNDLAHSIFLLVKNNANGVFNTSGSEYVDRLTFSLEAAKTFNLDVTKIVGVETKQLNQAAKRPRNGGLNCDLLTKVTQFKPKGVKDGLAAMKSQGGLS